jgi:uncharacterized protein (TIGR00297 family)
MPVSENQALSVAWPAVLHYTLWVAGVRLWTPPIIVTNVDGLSRFSEATAFLPGQWVLAVLLTLAFTVLARGMRGVTNSGALVGAVNCLVLYLCAGPGAFVALISVFALTWIATRLGYQRKQRLGIAERREGRKASQVLANLGVATACAALSLLSHTHEFFLVALAAALSEAAADTVSSELGQAFSEKARLITTWSLVPPGTDGAVSLPGTVAGILAAGIVSCVCVLGGLLPRSWLAISASAAILGMVADSFLGAWLERHRLVNNDSVNFLSTLVAASIAFWLA